jgi:hypothetical protein
MELLDWGISKLVSISKNKTQVKYIFAIDIKERQLGNSWKQHFSYLCLQKISRLANGSNDFKCNIYVNKEFIRLAWILCFFEFVKWRSELVLLLWLYYFIKYFNSSVCRKSYNRLAYMSLHLNGVGQPVSFAMNWWGG